LSRAKIPEFSGVKQSLFLRYFSKLGAKFRVSCSLFGVGYRITKNRGGAIALKLGRSYRVNYKIPKNISVRTFGKRKSKLRFYSSDLMRLIAAVYLFRLLRWPDNYKGKGIKLTKQRVQIKFREKFGSIHYKNKK
jgi:ribosomal protein L6P/L9E